MRLRNTLILGLVCVALGAWVYFVELEKAEREAREESLVDFDPETATAVTLTYPNRTIVLERLDDQWMMVEPVETKADQTTVKNLVRAVADADLKKTLDDPGDDLSPYGLDVPDVRVAITLEEGSVPDLRVGRTTPVGYSTYVQRGNEAAILLTGSAFHAGMDKSVTDLRDKMVLDLEQEDIESVHLTHDSGARVVLEKTGDAWQMTEPAGYTVDPSEVRSLLTTLTTMRATNFPTDSGEDLDLYGLDEPRVRAVVGRTGEQPDIALLLGDEQDGAAFVKLEDRPTVYEVGDWVLRDLEKDANAFRDKTILSFEPDDVQSIRIETRPEGEVIELQRTDDGWSMTDTERTPDPPKVESFLSNLNGLRGTEIVAESLDDPAAYGLAPPDITVTLGDAEGQIARVRFGEVETPEAEAADDEGEMEDLAHHAVADASPLVYRIRAYAFEDLWVTAEDFLPPPVTPDDGDTASQAGSS